MESSQSPSPLRKQTLYVRHTDVTYSIKLKFFTPNKITLQRNKIIIQDEDCSDSRGRI